MSEAITKARPPENAKNESDKERKCDTAKVHPEPNDSPSRTEAERLSLSFEGEGEASPPQHF